MDICVRQVDSRWSSGRIHNTRAYRPTPAVTFSRVKINATKDSIMATRLHARSSGAGGRELGTDIPGGCLSEVMHADKHLQILGRHASSHSQCRLHLLSATFSSQCDFAMSLQNHLSVVAASNALVSSFSSYLFSVDLVTSVLISSYSGKTDTEQVSSIKQTI